MSDGAQFQEQAAWEYPQHLSPTLKNNLVIKGKKKGGESGDKVDLTIKNVMFWNSTLVTYTYIKEKKSRSIYTEFFIFVSPGLCG